jgi:maltooligosyltrehalose trehalohydrolase
MPLDSRFRIGAIYIGKGICEFCVWAPLIKLVQVSLGPGERIIDLQKGDAGYHFGRITDLEPGTLYVYRLEGEKERPDPASRFQPRGVHGPSEIVNPHFAWENTAWVGLSLEDYVLYELHVGAFTRDGAFDAVIPYLDGLKDLGVTAIEIMPVAQFPGTRNWGYDGVHPFAAQNSYGGPEALKRLVDACHRRQIAVALDVVYNHLGPEGNYLADFGPYFTDRYRTPWGPAVNFDGPYSDEVRRFFIENALYWVTEFHIDALRLDAVHGIFDFSARHFLEELASAVHCRAEENGRKIYVIAESDLNDARLIKPTELGGYGLDAQWNDDFHHSLHALLTNERTGYYADFGRLSQQAKAFRERFVFSGQYSTYRARKHGNSSKDTPPSRFVVFSQNHDQVGNRPLGDRLGQTASFEKLKLAAATVLLSPYIPLLFMGEEYGETAPFPYFVDHADPSLIEAVRQGRKEEFAAFQLPAEFWNPKDEAVFAGAKLNHELREEGRHAILYKFYKELLKLRETIRSASQYGSQGGEVLDLEEHRLLIVSVSGPGRSFSHLFHFGAAVNSMKIAMGVGSWSKVLDSAETRWGGPGGLMAIDIVSDGYLVVSLQPWSVLVFEQL